MGEMRAWCGKHSHYGPWRKHDETARNDLRKHLRAKHKMSEATVEKTVHRTIPTRGIVGTFRVIP